MTCSFLRIFPQIRPLLVSAPQQGLEAVLSGKADAALASAAGMQPMLRQNYRGRLGTAGAINDLPVDLQMVVRKDEPQLNSIIAKTLRRLSAEDTDIMYEHALQEAG